MVKKIDLTRLLEDVTFAFLYKFNFTNCKVKQGNLIYSIQKYFKRKFQFAGISGDLTKFNSLTSRILFPEIGPFCLVSIFPDDSFERAKRRHGAKYIPISPRLFPVMQVVSRKLIRGAHSRIYFGFWFLHANHLSCFKGGPRFKGKWITGSPGTTVPFRSNPG